MIRALVTFASASVSVSVSAGVSASVRASASASVSASVSWLLQEATLSLKAITYVKFIAGYDFC